MWLKSKNDMWKLEVLGKNHRNLHVVSMEGRNPSSLKQLLETIKNTNLNNIIDHNFFLCTFKQAYDIITTFKC